MKNIKKILWAIVAVTTVALCSSGLTSCGAFANMSDEDAYYVGYGAGTLLRNWIDN